MFILFLRVPKSKVEIFMRGSSNICILYLLSKWKKEERRIIQTLNNLQLKLTFAHLCSHIYNWNIVACKTRIHSRAHSIQQERGCWGRILLRRPHGAVYHNKNCGKVLFEFTRHVIYNVISGRPCHLMYYKICLSIFSHPSLSPAYLNNSLHIWILMCLSNTEFIPSKKRINCLLWKPYF